MNIIFKEHKRKDDSLLGEVLINSPDKLNVLDLEILMEFKKQLEIWENKPQIKLVFLHSQGDRAFCAGGDVKKIHDLIITAKANNQDAGLAVQPFFETEYRLDYLIHTYPKPIVAWGNGIMMGGGLGIFVGCDAKIVTPSTMVSMPEINIGFFSDVGASYFLSRLPDLLGFYIALTAHRLDAQQALELKLANLYFNHEKKSDVFNFLLSFNFENKKDLINQLRLKEDSIEKKSKWLSKHRENIYEILNSKNLQKIWKNISQAKLQDNVRKKNQSTFLKASPSSLGIICEQLKRGESMSLKRSFSNGISFSYAVCKAF